MCSTASLRPIPDTPARSSLCECTKCSSTSLKPVPDTPVTVSTVRSENVTPPNTVSQPANIFDLNNLLILALQIEDQIKFNESELLE